MVLLRLSHTKTAVAFFGCRCLLDAVAFWDDCAPLLLFLFTLLTTHLQSRELMFVFPTLYQNILASYSSPLGYIFQLKKALWAVHKKRDFEAPAILQQLKILVYNQRKEI